MNYLAEIKRFYDSLLSQHLSASQISLWHALMEINNRNGWAEWFSAPYSALELYSGLSHGSVSTALKSLVELGYIEKCNRKYKICSKFRTNEQIYIINNKTKLKETKRKDDRNGQADTSSREVKLPTGIKL